MPLSDDRSVLTKRSVTKKCLSEICKSNRNIVYFLRSGLYYWHLIYLSYSCNAPVRSSIPSSQQLESIYTKILIKIVLQKSRLFSYKQLEPLLHFKKKQKKRQPSKFVHKKNALFIRTWRGRVGYLDLSGRTIKKVVLKSLFWFIGPSNSAQSCLQMASCFRSSWSQCPSPQNRFETHVE